MSGQFWRWYIPAVVFLTLFILWLASDDVSIDLLITLGNVGGIAVCIVLLWWLIK